MPVKDALRSAIQTAVGQEAYLYWLARWYVARPMGAELRTLVELARRHPDGDVLDVGAGIGMTCVHLARALPGRRVHAFEPHPSNRRVLDKVLRTTRTRDVFVHGVAAGDQEGSAEMVMPMRNGRALFGLAHVVHESIPDYNEGATVPVRVVALDDYLRAVGVRRVAGIKIDVENFEYYALRGCRATLARDRPAILCELWGNDHRARVIELLEGLGYVCFVREGGRFARFDATRTRHAQSLDFFFVAGEDVHSLEST